MKDLIEALNIFLKYADIAYPFHCSHEELQVHGIKSADVSEEDRKRLYSLGFFCRETSDDEPDEDDYWHDGHDGFISYKYGSC